MDDLLREFLTETSESLDVIDAELVRFEQQPDDVAALENIFRLVHTIKGTCGFLGLRRLEALTHAAESLMSCCRRDRSVTTDGVSLILVTIDRIKSLLEGLERDRREPQGTDTDLIARLQGMAGETAAEIFGLTAAHSTPPCALRAPNAIAANGRRLPSTDLPGNVDARDEGENQPKSNIANGSIRLKIDTLDRLMTMVSELVLTRNQLIEIVRRHQESEFAAPLQRLSHVTAQLQESVLKSRMQPIGNAWQKLPRVVRNLSAELKKPIELEMVGADTELDRQLIEMIKDPLTHMVRNAADHGIEPHTDRARAGKPERGLIRLLARHEGGHVLIEVSDDGRGLDMDRIRAKAVALGLGSQSEIDKLSQAQLAQCIFAPGFSTTDRITLVSGRGIGMDVVRANLGRIGGTIEVSSLPGRGTMFTIKIPLTLAIISALIVQAAGDRFAIPQAAVVEIVRPREHSGPPIVHIKDSPVLRLRDKLLPVVDLKSLLAIGDGREAPAKSGFVVVMQVGVQLLGLAVDRVFDTEEIVVKPMSARLRAIPVFSGNTILGDGSVILILDPNGVAQAVGVPRNAEPSQTRRREQSSEAASAESMLLFRAGSQTLKAVPLAFVTRLEEIDVAAIEALDDRLVLQYRNQLMPLLPASERVQIKSSGKQPLLVLSGDGRRFMGLIVDAMIDIVEERLAIEPTNGRPGILGSAVIKGQAAEILDLGHFLSLAYPDAGNCRERAGRTLLPRVLAAPNERAVA